MTLKIGSKGDLVKQLQEFLKITADGDFGPKTEAAVKEWQTKNGLKPDGVIGPKSWAAMGIASTDISENHTAAGLDIKEAFLPKKEYLAGPTKKEWVFLHHTAGWHNPYNTISAWGRDSRGPVATEFVLGGPSIRGNDNESDGVLVQAFPRGGYGWHLGTGNNLMHRNSVGIEVCNFGYVTKGGYFKWEPSQKRNVWIALKPDSFYTYVGTEAAPSQIVTLKKPFRNHQTWHRYSDLQVEVLKNWILYIAERDNIDVRKGLPDLIRQRGEDAFDVCDVAMCERTKGLWLHTNVQKAKVDLFPQEEIVEMLLSL